mgnify:CR=1 FL=1
MISCVIIDDEKPARETLKLMIERYLSDKIEVVETAGSLKKGVLAIYEYKPDLVFLDIEMPNEDGFKIFSYFQEVNFAIVFTTAYKEYSIKAIKVAALNYILKPINIAELKETIKLFEKRKGKYTEIIEQPECRKSNSGKSCTSNFYWFSDGKD